MKEFFKYLDLRKFTDLFYDRNVLKYLIVVYIIIILPVLLFVLFYYRNTTVIIQSEVTETMLRTVQQVKVNLDDRMNSIKDISDMAFSNEIILDGMANKSQTNIYDDRIEMLNMTKEIAKFGEGNKIYKMRFYVVDNKTYANTQTNFMPFGSFQKSEWYERTKQKNGGIEWIPVHYEKYLDTDDEYVISSVRLVKDKNNINDVIGGLKIDIKADAIFDVTKSVGLSGEEKIFIIDNSGNVVYPYNNTTGTNIKEIYGNNMEFLDNNAEGINKISNHYKGEYIIYSQLKQAGWKIVVYLPMKAVMAKNTTLNMIVTFIVVIFIILLIMFMTTVMFGILNKKINYRINKIVLNMKEFGAENYAVDNEYKGISLLEKNVDGMIGTVERLVAESYESKLKEREATLKALQAQINPHFLYNTLNLINLMAVRCGEKDMSNLLNALSKYFRLTLNKGKDIVKVSDELELARVYLEIQQKRFEGNLEYIIETDESISDYLMPKLTLQPIIENSIIHGILEKDDKRGTIKIRSYLKGDNIVFEVSDNGVGISSDKLETLTAIPKDGKQSESYALYNICERLKVFFGNDYGFKISSRIGFGTTVTVTVKAMHNE